MIHTIAFAKWFLNKHRQSGILVDGNDFEFILSQLDQSSWDEFNATADSIAISKTTADTLIPQLVEKMPKKPRIKNPEKNKKEPKGKKTKVDVDVQTSTDVNDTPVLENGEAVIEKPLLKKEVKKRGPKAAIKIEPTSDNVVEEQPLPAPEKKEVKKRGPKTAKNIVDIAENVDQQNPIVKEVVGEQPLPVPDKKEVKKRGPKAAKKIEEANVVGEQPLPVPAPEKKEVKKRGPKAVKKDVVVVENEEVKNNHKKSIVAPDDVVIPINEQVILGGDLQEDQYQDDVELTEIFIDEVLFYKDGNGSWFDALLNLTSDPTL